METQRTTTQFGNQPQAEFLQTNRYPGIVILKFSGCITSEVLKTNNIPNKLNYLLNQKYDQFILDFLNTDQVDSSVLGMIAMLAKYHATVKVICEESSLIYQTLYRLNLFSVLLNYRSLGEALNHFPGS